MSFFNATPFAALDVPVVDRNGVEVVVVIVKATFQVVALDRVVLADEPVEVRVNDVLRTPDDPKSSALYPSDLCTEKVGTDVVVVGEAASARAVTYLDVAVKVRDATVPLRVHGHREYFRSMLEMAISAPVPFERMPIEYERAYGGMSQDFTLADLRNPSGVGVAKRTEDLAGTRAPQLEHPALPYKTSKDAHAPVGFGSLLPHWSPRRDCAGTFDDAWKATRMPLMPADFSPRHNNVAAPSLVFDTPLAAGDSIATLRMTIPELFGFTVPRVPLVITARYDHRTERVEPTIDTLLVEPSRGRFEIVMRKAFPVGRGKESLRELQAAVEHG